MLLKLAALGAVGYAGYKYYEKNQAEQGGTAFGAGQSGRVRDAGPESTKTGATNWSKTDEAIDESFPASDPPANY